ncbi:MAG: metallophosphoesterase [Pseudomonadota bacterium]
MLSVVIYFGAYIFFPFLALAALAVARGDRIIRGLAILALIPACILAWARFVEPAILNVKRADILLPGATKETSAIRVALFADTHFGKFGNALPMARIVETVNRQDVDLVLLAGDLVYHPKQTQITTEISALEGLQAPVLAILGNHDVGKPGRDNREAVRSAFTAVNIPLLEDEAKLIRLNGRTLAVSGLRDLWDDRALNTAFAADIPPDVPHITLAHNPDTAMYLSQDFEYDLMLSGHTHGGQIRLPFFYRAAIPCEGDWDKDLHTWRDAGGIDRQVWVTSGTGMVGLPFRFLQPPRIDILTLHLPEASSVQ